MPPWIMVRRSAARVKLGDGAGAQVFGCAGLGNRHGDGATGVADGVEVGRGDAIDLFLESLVGKTEARSGSFGDQLFDDLRVGRRARGQRREGTS